MQERTGEPSTRTVHARNAVLAADVRAGEEPVLAQEVGKIPARLDLGLDAAPIDGQ
jgi:hypothetical protein